MKEDAHFRAIAEFTAPPIVLHDIPSRAVAGLYLIFGRPLRPTTFSFHATIKEVNLLKLCTGLVRRCRLYRRQRNVCVPRAGGGRLDR